MGWKVKRVDTWLMHRIWIYCRPPAVPKDVALYDSCDYRLAKRKTGYITGKVLFRKSANPSALNFHAHNPFSDA